MLAMGKPTSPGIEVGSVSIESTGGDVIIRSMRVKDAAVTIPAGALEAWCLRKLRDDIFRPDGKKTELETGNA